METPPATPLEKPKRPTYIGWLAAYLAIYGGILFVMQLLAYKNLTEAAVVLNISPLSLLISIIFQGVIGITAGVGLWWGKKWGWWLAAFNFLYALARETNIFFFPDSLAAGGARSWFSFGLGLLTSVAVLFYLYSRNIRAHFHLEKFPRWLSLLILVAAVALVSVLL